MSLILNIDTAVEAASIALADNGQLVGFRANENQRDHGQWIHEAINELLKQYSYTLKNLKAIAVTNGPGSYTGLRIGLSTAKGLCYALNIPLICVGTLEMMAQAALNQLSEELLGKKNILLCPMIDARRLEVYTALYTPQLKEIVSPSAIILEPQTFHDDLEKQVIVFFGNGSDKFRNILLHSNAIYVENISPGAIDMSGLTFEYYRKNQFAALAYAEPLYIKEFHTAKSAN